MNVGIYIWVLQSIITHVGIALPNDQFPGQTQIQNLNYQLDYRENSTLKAKTYEEPIIITKKNY